MLKAMQLRFLFAIVFKKKLCNNLHMPGKKIFRRVGVYDLIDTVLKSDISSSVKENIVQKLLDIETTEKPQIPNIEPVSTSPVSTNPSVTFDVSDNEKGGESNG